MKLPSIPYLADAFLQVIRRFPLVMIATAFGVVVSMILIERDSGTEGEAYIKLLLPCLVGLSTLLCAAIVCERWQLRFPSALAAHLVALGLLVIYYFSLRAIPDLDESTTPIRFIGLNLAAHLGVAFIPYLNRSPVEDFWEYNKRLFGNFMVGAFYSLVIFAGLGFAILAVNELFNLHIDGKIYAHLFVVIAGIFNTAYFLAHFPKRFDFATENVENQELAETNHLFTSPLKNLTKFILIPIVAIYFLILYAFSAKILLTWELPEGWVGKLVLGFSVAGIFTYLLNYLLVKYDDSMAVKGFRRWFFLVLLPMVVLLFVAIGRRINDYGVTESRYVVAIAGIWLLLMSVYFIASKRDNIKFIPISLAFFSLLTVLGPFSAFKVSERSQIGRLKAIFERNNMFKDGKLVAAQDTISRMDAGAIESAIIYLRGREKLDEVTPWFGVPKDSLEDWQGAYNALKKLGISTDPNVVPNSCYVYFERGIPKAIDVAGYDLLYVVYLYGDQTLASNFTGFDISTGGHSLQYYEAGEKRDSFDLLPYLQRLEAGEACSKPTQADSMAIYEATSAAYQFKLVTDNLSFDKTGNWKLRELTGKVLLRKKQ